ncbi:MAG TPA: tetratricopeptide repeat protein, partial [Rhizomicrobium sp.]|nr:tetratricopeptide repeat protein [Rhizomicrobium sp.]
RLAAALAAGQGGDRADRFLDEQTRLTRLQIEQLEEENATRRRMLKLEHASAAMKVAFELAVALIVTIVAIGLGAMIWSAASDRGLVVESFSVPPDLANRGLTGDVIAAKLLDNLSSLQSQTVSSRAASSYANNWGNDIKLQIPDTGISIGEFNRSLHTWLGHQTRISGEVYRTPAGLSVTARAGNATSPTFTGTDADLDKLIRQAAESVYHATQPYRYAVYLANVGRTKEAEAAYLALIANGSPKDRAWAHIGIENIYNNRGEYARALAELRAALALKPDFIMSYVNEAGLEGQFQHDEAGLIAQRKALAIARGPRDPDMSEQAWVIGAIQAEASAANAVGNYKSQLAFDRRLSALPDFNNAMGNAQQNDIVAHALLHDGAAVEAAFRAFPPANDDLTFLQRNGVYAFAKVLLGDPTLVVANRARFDKALATLGGVGTVIQKRQFWPPTAYGLALKGDFRSAHALIDRTPVDCGQCLRIRGGIDALEKNWGGAAYWFSRAVRDAPSVPFAYDDWGRMLLAKGDYNGAIAKLRIAHEKGPDFADPLEHWGEALMAQHRADLALAKFEQANKYAPNWQRLHQKWGEALSYLGRKDEASNQFTLARKLAATNL